LCRSPSQPFHTMEMVQCFLTFCMFVWTPSSHTHLQLHHSTGYQNHQNCRCLFTPASWQQWLCYPYHRAEGWLIWQQSMRGSKFYHPFCLGILCIRSLHICYIFGLLILPSINRCSHQCLCKCT
jgi:hypothetical protein